MIRVGAPRAEADARCRLQALQQPPGRLDVAPLGRAASRSPTASACAPLTTVCVRYISPDALTRSIKPRVASSPARSRNVTSASGCGATSSKRSSASTQDANSCASSTCAADVRPQALGAVPADDRPQLQGAEPATERHLPVAVVDHRAGLGGGVAQVLGQDRQRADQRRPVGDPEGVAVEVGQQPLVRVGAVGVGGLESVVEPAQLGRDGRHPGPRRVDVQPRTVRARDARRVRATGSTRPVPVAPTEATTSAGVMPSRDVGGDELAQMRRPGPRA